MVGGFISLTTKYALIRLLAIRVFKDSDTALRRPNALTTAVKNTASLGSADTLIK